MDSSKIGTEVWNVLIIDTEIKLLWSENKTSM